MKSEQPAALKAAVGQGEPRWPSTKRDDVQPTRLAVVAIPLVNPWLSYHRSIQ